MIRPAEQDDLDDMLLLLQQLFSIEIDFNFDATQQRKGLELLLDSTSAIIMVAEEQDSAIAMGTAQLVISTAEGKPSLLVEDVVKLSQSFLGNNPVLGIIDKGGFKISSVNSFDFINNS